MFPPSYRSSRPDSWILPRPYSDPCARLKKYGRIQPMDKNRSLIQRLLGTWA